MTLWGIRYHVENPEALVFEPSPRVYLANFSASPKGAFVIVESETRPHPQADQISALPRAADLSKLTLGQKLRYWWYRLQQARWTEYKRSADTHSRYYELQLSVLAMQAGVEARRKDWTL